MIKNRDNEINIKKHRINFPFIYKQNIISICPIVDFYRGIAMKEITGNRE